MDGQKEITPLVVGADGLGGVLVEDRPPVVAGAESHPGNNHGIVGEEALDDGRHRVLHGLPAHVEGVAPAGLELRLGRLEHPSVLELVRVVEGEGVGCDQAQQHEIEDVFSLLLGPIGRRDRPSPVTGHDRPVLAGLELQRPVTDIIVLGSNVGRIADFLAVVSEGERLIVGSPLNVQVSRHGNRWRQGRGCTEQHHAGDSETNVIRSHESGPFVSALSVGAPSGACNALSEIGCGRARGFALTATAASIQMGP